MLIFETDPHANATQKTLWNNSDVFSFSVMLNFGYPQYSVFDGNQRIFTFTSKKKLKLENIKGETLVLTPSGELSLKMALDYIGLNYDELDISFYPHSNRKESTTPIGGILSPQAKKDRHEILSLASDYLGKYRQELRFR